MTFKDSALSSLVGVRWLWICGLDEGQVFIRALGPLEWVGAMVRQVVKADDRGRITIPVKIREEVGLKAGGEVEVRCEEDRVIVVPVTERRTEKLSEILGEVHFDREARRRGERWLLERSHST